ncbi:4-hydroxybenzoate octaprenyltransferase [Insolitispirillum peregrinum]|uniref:4-hydroxybenzoate octaprenyltransferase n=1 Tax=Insolitispirillum peregrinum TaxID=80876 RepID=UPI0036D28492
MMNSAPTPSDAPGMIGDMPADGWIDRYVPSALRPYLKLMRLDRPIGTWLLLFPCWWSITLANADGTLSVWRWLYLMVLFGVGALVMRGAGCTVNDLFDRDIDARVARTAMRPLACGAVSVRQALWFLALQLLIGLAVLVQLNKQTVVLGACSLLLVGVYPLMKRLTHWPQAWLGLTFNWGALLGWVAVQGRIDWPPVVLYVAGLFWTLGYDTIYAHQDKDDDVQVGVKSTALALGERTQLFLWLFYGLTIGLMVLTGVLVGLHWLAWPLLALAGAHLAWQAAVVRINDSPHCLYLFRSNRLFGWLVLAAFAAGAML